MVNRLPLTHQLRDLGQLLGLPQLEWDEQQSCTLEFGDDLSLTMYVDEDRPDVTLYTVLGALTAATPVSTWQQLMEANLFGSGTQGATLGYESGAELLYLTQRLPLETLTPQRWLSALQGFVSVGRTWQRKLNDLGVPQAEAPLSVSANFYAALRA